LDLDQVARMNRRRQRSRDPEPGDFELVGQPVGGQHPRRQDDARVLRDQCLKCLRVRRQRRQLGVDQGREIRGAGAGERIDAHLTR
jgi:hypothetical protein